MNMRELVISRIKDSGWCDYSFKRGDRNAIAFNGDYKAWLNSLDDDDVLDAYDRVQEFMKDID